MAVDQPVDVGEGGHGLLHGRTPRSGRVQPVSYTHLVSPGAVERMVEDLRREGRRNIAYRVYPRLDHGLRDVDGASRMGEVADDMAAWLRDLPAR